MYESYAQKQTGRARGTEKSDKRSMTSSEKKNIFNKNRNGEGQIEENKLKLNDISFDKEKPAFERGSVMSFNMSFNPSTRQTLNHFNYCSGNTNEL